MELRLGPGGNRDEVIRRLRESLLEVTTTERQLRSEIERLTAERERLGPATSVAPAPPVDLPPRENAGVPESSETESAPPVDLPPAPDDPAARLDARLADLRTQLTQVQQARDEIAKQLENLPSLAVQSEAQAHVDAVHRLLAAAGIEDVDRGSLEPLTELSTLSVDEELAALRREMGLEPPPPATPAPDEPEHPPKGPNDTPAP